MACSPSKPLPWTPTPLTYTPCFVPCERMWPGSHPRGGVNPNDGLLRHIAQHWASLSSWPSLPIGLGPPGPPLKRPIVWHGSSGDNVPCLHTMTHGILCGSPASTFAQSQWVELAIKARYNWWETCRFCAVYNNAQCRSMCLHQRRQLCTIEQRHCQSQSNGVCAEWRGGGSVVIGGGVCVSWMFKGDAKIQCGTPEAKDRGWVAMCRIWENKNWKRMDVLFTNWMNTRAAEKSH